MCVCKRIHTLSKMGAELMADALDGNATPATPLTPLRATPVCVCVVCSGWAGVFLRRLGTALRAVPVERTQRTTLWLACALVS